MTVDSSKALILTLCPALKVKTLFIMFLHSFCCDNLAFLFMVFFIFFFHFLFSFFSFGENGNPLQYYCLENPMDITDWKATVLGVSRVRHDLPTKPPPPPNVVDLFKELALVFQTSLSCICFSVSLISALFYFLPVTWFHFTFLSQVWKCGSLIPEFRSAKDSR